MTKVLIVDDSKLARMVIVKAVTTFRPDWVCAEAVNAIDALAAAQQDIPQLALLDYNMPGRNGLELLTDLRSLCPDMIVAVISANIQRDVVDQTQLLAATFIPKPLNQEMLAAFLAGCGLD